MVSGQGSPAGSDMANLARRVEGIERKMAELDAANNAAKMASRAITVLVLAVALGGLTAIVWPLAQAAQNPKPYTDALAKELEARLWPALTAEIQIALKNSGPKVQDAATKVFNKRQNEIARVTEKEVETLLADLRTYAQDELVKRSALVEESLEVQVAEYLPEIKDADDRTLVMGNAELAASRAVEKVVTEKLGGHIEALARIQTQIDQFPVPEHLRTMDEMQLHSELQRALAEYGLRLVDRSLDRPEERANAVQEVQ